jgi:AcrR family transcriptional regulator
MCSHKVFFIITQNVTAVNKVTLASGLSPCMQTSSSRYTREMISHRKKLKVELLNTAYRLCEADGSERLSLRVLAAEVGVSHTAVYRHFKNKNDLLTAIKTEGFNRLGSILQVNYAGLTANQAMAEFVLAAANYVQFGLENRQIYALMFSQSDLGLNDKDLADQRQRTFNYLIAGVAKNFELGSPKQRLNKSYQIWASVHGLVDILCHHNPDDEIQSNVDWIINNLTTYLVETTFNEPNHGAR